MTPELFAAFMSGRLRALFEWDERTLEDRINHADVAFHDRTFSTLEVLCSGDSWRVAVSTMISRAHVVVMDLRGFKHQNRGCSWELAQLATLIPLSRVLICVDKETEWAALEMALNQANGLIPENSPNASRTTFQILEVGAHGHRIADFAVRLANAPNKPGGPIAVERRSYAE